MKRFFSLLMAAALMVVLLPNMAYAKEAKTVSSCSLSSEITIKKVVNYKVINGKLYIDVIEEEPRYYTDRMEYGPCKNPYKYTTKKVSRKELINIRNKEKTENGIARACINLLFSGLGLYGDVIQLLPTDGEKLVAEYNRALETNKNSFTMTSKLKCVQGDMGSRGIVHHYRVESITIR